MKDKEALGLFLVLAVLERLVDPEGVVSSVYLLRFQVVELVGLDVDDAVRFACSRLVSLWVLCRRRALRTTGLDGIVADIVVLLAR